MLGPALTNLLNRLATSRAKGEPLTQDQLALYEELKLLIADFPGVVLEGPADPFKREARADPFRLPGAHLGGVRINPSIDPDLNHILSVTRPDPTTQSDKCTCCGRDLPLP